MIQKVDISFPHHHMQQRTQDSSNTLQFVKHQTQAVFIAVPVVPLVLSFGMTGVGLGLWWLDCDLTSLTVRVREQRHGLSYMNVAFHKQIQHRAHLTLARGRLQ